MQIANLEQAQAWDAHEGDVWAAHADRYDRGHRFLQAWFDAQGIVQRSDRVLDLGCGSGRSTLAAARDSADGAVLGVDLSRAMLDVARARAAAEGLTNVQLEQGDAQVHPLPEDHDLAISAFGAMFFGDPVAAFANVGAALRPGGRLAILAWRSLRENEWLRVLRSSLAAGRDLPEPPTRGTSPLGLSEPEHVRDVLSAAGYDAVELQAVDEPMDFGDDADDALGFAVTTGIYEGLTRDLDDAAVAAVTEELRAALAAAETPEGVLLGSAAWLITAVRR
jgi:SAM-dependent methyltransferase